jgi:hypothetical protein
MYISRDNDFVFPLVLAFISILFIAGAYRVQDDKLKRGILISIIVSGTLNLYLNASVIPHLFSYQGARQVAKIFSENKEDGDRLYNFEVEEYEIFFIADEPVVQIGDWNELYRVMEKPGTWIYTNTVKFNDIMGMKYDIEKVYQIRQRGMNKIDLKFLDPKTRSSSLQSNYLIKISDR